MHAPTRLMGIPALTPVSRNIENSRRNRRKTIEKTFQNLLCLIKFSFQIKYQPIAKLCFRKYCIFRDNNKKIM